MTRVKQTPHEGNCLQAAIASLLELPIEEVPDFRQIPDEQTGGWFNAVVNWAYYRNLGTVHFYFTDDTVPTVSGVRAIAVGSTKRGTSNDDHAIVVNLETKGNELLVSHEHDPHASNAMLDKVHYCFFFVPI